MAHYAKYMSDPRFGQTWAEGKARVEAESKKVWQHWRETGYGMSKLP